ncbi:MAG: TlpA disulfide reductase family protein, partial [Anaerolineales bacterium]
PAVQPTAIVTEAPLPSPQPEQPTESSAVQAAPAAEALPPAEPKVGFLAPDLTLSTLDGSSIRLADLRGKNVLINYWVTWCIPCMAELPVLSQLSQVYQEQNVVILAVNGIQQDQLGDVQQVVAELGLTQPVLLDEHESFWSTYLVQFLPTSFFIDSQGVIRHIMLGSATEDVIRSKLDMLITNQL